MTKPIRPLRQDVHAVVLVPSNDEWKTLRETYAGLRPGMALGREFLSRSFNGRRVVFVHTGEDAVEAAVSAQYAIDRWSPRTVASNTPSPAFTHVAERNRLNLIATTDLRLETVVEPPPPSPVEPTPEETATETTPEQIDLELSSDASEEAVDSGLSLHPIEPQPSGDEELPEADPAATAAAEKA